MESTAAILRRRNGSQQACEPCRKGKIACDHALPTCGRCKRRKTFSQCQYINAPMSKARNGNSSPRRISNATTVITPSTSPAVSTSTRSRHDHASTVSGPFNPSSGYYGSTSFSAVFLENRGTFRTDLPDTPEAHQSAEDSNMHSPVMCASSLGSTYPRMADAIKVLRKIPNREMFKSLLEWFSRLLPMSSTSNIAVDAAAASLWEAFGAYLQEPRKDDDLKRMAQILFVNGENALEEPEDYPSWLAAFTGKNFRWEIMSITFSRLGMSAMCQPEQTFTFNVDKQKFGREMKECAQICTELMMHGDMINPLMVAAMFVNKNFQTMISGDASLVVWRQTGDMVSAVTALGLHLQEDTSKPVTIGSEMRRRLWMSTFSSDKTFASLTGRPPMLSHRYIRCPMAYDLSDESLMLPREELAKEVAELDENGWSRKNVMYPVTASRANYMIHLIHAEVLEISLGNEEQISQHRIQDLTSRLDVTYANFPPIIQYRKSEPLLPSGNFVLIRQILMRMHYLRIKHFLHKLAIKHCDAGTQALVDCAVELLDLSIFLWVHRDAYVELHADIDYMLICYCVPAAGILCIELLKANHDPTLPQARFSRSEVVQNLSMVVGCLNWVRPSAPNYSLCISMRKIIKHVLDQILEPQVVSQQPDPQTFLYNELGDDFGPIDYLQNLDWLDTRFEWMPAENGFNVHHGLN